MYYILHKDGNYIGVSVIEPPLELTMAGISAEGIDEPIPDLNKSIFDFENGVLISSRNKTKLEFLSSFSMGERIAINSSSDPIVIDIMNLFNAAQYVNLDDVATVNALYYFMSVGLLTESRVAAILGA